MTASAELYRCSLNQATINDADLVTAIEACVRAGVPSIGVWRRQLAQRGALEASRALRAAGLRVSSLCRGGFFTSDDDSGWRRELDDNRRAIDDAHTLGSPVLVLVPGGIPDGGSLARAHARVREAIEALVPHAASAGITLALEPMHPVFAADRGVVSTIAHALEIVDGLPAEIVGIAVDSYHVWWDPRMTEQITRAGASGRLALVQVADWLPPTGDPLVARAFPGEGRIDFASFATAVEAAGYTGSIEWEIFNASLWKDDPLRVAARVAEAHRLLLAPALSHGNPPSQHVADEEAP